MGAKKTPFGIVAITICCMILTSVCPRLGAQAASGSPQLIITILDGEDALNDIRQRTAREPIVQVTDENHKPIAGAAVLFLLPGSGPSGSFADGAQTLSTVTDSTGRAVAQGLRPNTVSGSYNIHVKVTFNGSTSETNIHQQNVSGHSSASQHATHAVSAKVVLIAVGVAVAAGAVVAALELSGGNSTVITAGTPNVGPPTPAAGIRIQLHRHN